MRIWNASTGKERASFRAAASRVNAIAYSPDGKGLATGSLDGPIGLWDSRNGNPEGILRGHTDPVFEVAFSNDGTKLISAGQHATIKVWDLASDRGVRFLRAPVRGKDLETSNNGNAPLVRWRGGVAFRPDGAQVAAAGTDETVALWDLHSGNLERTLETPMGSAFALAYDPTGARLAFAGSDRSVWVNSLTSAAGPLVISDHMAGIASVAFSHDGKTIATGGGDAPEIVQAPIGKFAPAPKRCANDPPLERVQRRARAHARGARGLDPRDCVQSGRQAADLLGRGWHRASVERRDRRGDPHPQKV